MSEAVNPGGTSGERGESSCAGNKRTHALRDDSSYSRAREPHGSPAQGQACHSTSPPPKHAEEGATACHCQEATSRRYGNLSEKIVSSQLEPTYPDKGATSPEEEELSDDAEDIQDAAEGPDDIESINDEEDECVLDESSEEDAVNHTKKKGKKKADSRQLRMQVQSAQGKRTLEDDKNSKRKANEDQQLWVSRKSYGQH